MTSSPSQPARQGVHLTRRGRQARGLVLVLCVLALLFGLVHACGSGSQQTAVPAAPSSPAAAPASASASSRPTPGATASAASPSPGASGVGEGDDVTGLRHSGLLGKGTWRRSTFAAPAPGHHPVVRRFIVETEDGTGIDPDDAARQVVAVLDDPRGWTGFRGVSFELVTDPAKADFTVYLASPGRVQKMCPLDVHQTWSCSAGPKVLLNTDRWLYGTPGYTDLAAYRTYMVNHEVGHFIGLGHRPCPGPGQPAPVMMQQSKGLGGCAPNPWPTPVEKG